ncbi:hypothetical protein DSO57_1034285 [Entomophthora muscae]|uniref:Uncharacterized protein n=1 Tax=Entomophthora muscae TaxID=34485 RepID=A0ACC2TB74_9FUNG|nr:hypothetical protein DSO57_1034285 [Entomophthora muscae]
MNLFTFALLSIAVLFSRDVLGLAECGKEGQTIEASSLGSCEVLLGNLNAHNVSELHDLKEIKGVLYIKAPFNATRAFKVFNITIQDIRYKYLNFKLVEVQALTIIDARGTTLYFENEPEEFKLLQTRNLKVRGMTGSRLKKLEIHDSDIPFPLAGSTSIGTSASQTLNFLKASLTTCTLLAWYIYIK